MRLHRCLLVILCLGLLGGILGCGKDPLGRRPVSGMVTLNGTPLADGKISFQPTEGATTSSGAVIAQGEYSIPREKGLPPGKYRVVINAIKPGTGYELPAGAMPGDEVGTPPEELIPPEWNAESENFVEVSASGANEFTHDIVVQAE